MRRLWAAREARSALRAAGVPASRFSSSKRPARALRWPSMAESGRKGERAGHWRATDTWFVLPPTGLTRSTAFLHAVLRLRPCPRRCREQQHRGRVEQQRNHEMSHRAKAGLDGAALALDGSLFDLQIGEGLRLDRQPVSRGCRARPAVPARNLTRRPRMPSARTSALAGG
jgi:hypothetical protein